MQTAGAGDAHHQRRKDEWRDDSLDQPQENLATRRKRYPHLWELPSNQHPKREPDEYLRGKSWQFHAKPRKMRPVLYLAKDIQLHIAKTRAQDHRRTDVWKASI